MKHIIYDMGRSFMVITIISTNSQLEINNKYVI